MLKKKSLLKTAGVLLFLFVETLLWGMEIPFQSDTDYESFSRRDEPLQTMDLARLLLVASGLPENRMEDYLSSIQTILGDSDSWFSNSKTINENAENLLRFMHEDMLNRYVLTQTKVDTLLENGNYNCVSSAVVFMMVARYHNILVKGIHAEDHAFCLLPGMDGKPDVDIETTSEWGFDPGSRKEFQSTFTNRTGFVYVPPGNYSTRVLLGDKDMAGLILQNRIVELQKRNLHLEALTLAADRYVLTGSQQALSDYFDTVQNAAALLNTRRDYLGAAEIIIKAESGPFGIPDSLKKTRSQILFNACAELVNQNRLDEARSLLTEKKNYIQSRDAESIGNIILQRDLEIKVSGDFSVELIDEIKNASDNGALTKDKAISLAAYHYSLEAEAMSRSENHKEALIFLENIPDWIKSDREYRRVLSILKQNAAIDYHNQIVQLLNSDNKTQAAKLLKEALELVPGNNILLQDQKTLSR